MTMKMHSDNTMDNTMNEVITMTKDEEGKRMDRMMRTGIIAAGTVAAGLAFGMSPVPAYAAEVETDATEEAVQEEAAEAKPATVADAKDAVENAKTNVDTTEAAVSEAQVKADDAQQEVRKAEETADSARHDAEEAFGEAKAEAAKADDSAQKEAETAEQNVNEAEEKYRQSETDAAAAEEALREAENNVTKAKEESPVSETDIEEKETELDSAAEALSEAEETMSEAEKAGKDAESNVDEKEAAQSAAEETVTAAEEDKNTADQAAAEAQERVDEATAELQSAEDLRDGNKDIAETVQYQEEQKAQEILDKAAENARIAADEVSRAQESYTNAQAAVDAARKELASAESALDEKQQALVDAGRTKAETEDSKEAAQAAYDKAAMEAAKAESGVKDAESALADAGTALTEAKALKDKADEAVEAARQAVTETEQEAEAAVNADIGNAETDVAARQKQTAAAQKAIAEAEEKYKQGTLGLIDWMLAKTGLTKDQQQDLQYARKVLENASEEDFSRWGGDTTGLPEERNGKVVVIGDEKDATSLDNLQKSIEIMKKINELRASDDNYTGDLQRKASYTNFYFMATAEAGAMRGAGLTRHSSLTTSCENLAFGYTDPTVGWYNKEKAVFDRIKGELGITEITSMSDVERIDEEADRQGVVIGHYTNLLWAADQVMGVGYTEYGKYRTTSCYNASKASNYTDDRYNRAMHLYSVEEFGKLVSEYLNSIDIKNCEAALEEAEASQKEAEDKLKKLTDEKDSVIEAAVKKAEEALADKVTEADRAGQKLSEAQQAYSDADKALAVAADAQKLAEQAASEAQNQLTEAIRRSSEADMNYVSAEKDRDDAGQAARIAQEGLDEAIKYAADAQNLLNTKSEALAEANISLNLAEKNHTDAAEKLAALTSDGTIGVLMEQKRLAEAALQTALEDKQAREDALALAGEALEKAQQDALEARTALGEAQKRLASATLERDAAQGTVTAASAELEQLRKQYEPVYRAIAAREEASRESDRAADALKGAEEARIKAKGDLADALLAKEAAADRLTRATGLTVDEALTKDIEDEDFAWLNGYVTAVREADRKLEAARSELEAANQNLLARRADSDNARKSYIAAVADLALLQDQTGAPRNDTVLQLSTDETPKVKEPVNTVSDMTAVTAEASDDTARKASFDNSDHVDNADNADNAEAVLTEAEEAGYINQVDSVETGDKSKAMALLAELLAGSGLMAVIFKKRREAEEADRQ